jgi:DNA-binding transcriptional ArsR family regulator
MQDCSGLFKLFSTDKKIEIIELLKKGDMNVNAIAKSLGITQSAVSQHLRVLKAVGLVKNERKGYWIKYSLNRKELEKFRQRLNMICSCGCIPKGKNKKKK